MSDVSEYFFLSALMKWLAEIAPAVHLIVVPLDPASVSQTMRTGAVDIAVGYIPDIGEDVTSDYLFTDSFVCLVRPDHPVLNDYDALLSLASLSFVYADTSAAGHSLIERWLTEIGVKRRITLRLGHLMVASSVVRDTDHAVIFPGSVSRLLNGDGPVQRRRRNTMVT